MLNTREIHDVISSDPYEKRFSSQGIIHIVLCLPRCDQLQCPVINNKVRTPTYNIVKHLLWLVFRYRYFPGFEEYRVNTTQPEYGELIRKCYYNTIFLHTFFIRLFASVRANSVELHEEYLSSGFFLPNNTGGGGIIFISSFVSRSLKI